MIAALVRWALFLAIVGGGTYWWITRPAPLTDADLAGHVADLTAGERAFYAGGCASCHAAPGASGDDKLILAGGRSFKSDFGTFLAPNISSDPVHGIGTWSALDLANAMVAGVSPGGSHYYPAFPYTSYVKADLSDIVSLHAFLQTLPASDVASLPNDIGFPFNIRRNLGAWKWLNLDPDWVLTGDLTEEQIRGRALVEALGHCTECHTPRDALGGLDHNRWLGGAANPSGPGRIPNITPAVLDWSKRDIVEYLTSGFTPEFDTAGGTMVDVIENTAKLSEADRQAIAAYLKAVPGVPNP
ncbi:MAG: cytochrome c [Pseudomonadota bacterium]